MSRMQEKDLPKTAMSIYLTRYRKSMAAQNTNVRCNPKPGEIWYVSNLDNIKDRPILVLSCDKGMVRFRKCTSQTSVFRCRDVIEDYYDAGLNKATYVDPEIRTISKSSLLWKLGDLSEYDRQRFGF